MKLGEWVKRYREDHGLSMQNMADICGFSKAYIGMLESGINPTTGKPLSPKIDTFQKIAKIAGLELDTFLNMLDDVQPITVGDGIIYERGTCDITRKVIKQKPIPILGTIAAGIPIEAQQDIEGYVMPECRIKADFALRVRGTSMINANIMDGDVVFIRQQPDVDDGEIAAVLIDNEATLKRVYRHDNAVELRPANDTMKSFFYTESDFADVTILGKCVGYMHGYE